MTINLFPHQDRLKKLDDDLSTKKKLAIIHDSMRHFFPFIERVAVALYDKHTGMLRTFIYSEDHQEPIQYYEEALSDSKTLQEIVKRRQPRVVNNLNVFQQDQSYSLQKQLVEERYYRSSYTMPVFNQEILSGFIFFNSPNENSFTDEVLEQLDIYGHLISQIVTREINAIRILLAFFDLLINLIHEKDPETADHIERVSRFSRLIAIDLAKAGLINLNDEAIEYIYKFAGLHDLGKIAIPDQILAKPSSLEPDEWKIMKTHSLHGSSLAERITEIVGYLIFSYAEYARNIPDFHHEKLDGSGYPYGLKDHQIPIEARIVATADVFDALTSVRPYKEAWTNSKAFEELRRLSEHELDSQCVEALIRNEKDIIRIQNQFAE